MGPLNPENCPMVGDEGRRNLALLGANPIGQAHISIREIKQALEGFFYFSGGL